MELTRREAIAAGIGLIFSPLALETESQIAGKVTRDSVITYQGMEFVFERDLVMRSDEKWMVFAHRTKGRTQMLDPNTLCPVYPLEDVTIKYLFGIDEQGEFKPMPCLIERGQTVKVICNECQYDDSLSINELPPLEYVITT